MEKIQLNSKSIARIAAIQTIYQYNNNPNADIKSILMRIVEFYKDKEVLKDFEIDINIKVKLKPSYNYLNELVEYTHKNFDEINDKISEFLTSEEKLQGMSKLLLTILQVAVCELTYFPETPKNVIINEFTDIANDMLDVNDVGFVNSILDKLSANLSKNTKPFQKLTSGSQVIGERVSENDEAISSKSGFKEKFDD